MKMSPSYCACSLVSGLFFFSSRRRHTRYWRDWSSDVCSSDLVVLGALLFVLGFSAVFVSYGALFGGLGSVLRENGDLIARVMGVVLIGLGLVYAGWVPGAAREWRWHVSPAVGLAGAPLVGALFGIGWTACTGPTLAAVQALAFNDGSAARGALLSLVYCLGLGLPFVLAALAYRRALGALQWVRRHQLWV